MTNSSRSWFIALATAVFAHGALFAAIKAPDVAKIERSAGPQITITGSLSALATQMQPISSAEPIEPVKAETLPNVEPEPVSEPVSEVAAVSQATPVTAIEPVTTQAIIPAQKIKPVKPRKVQIKPRPRPVKKKPVKKKIVKKKVDQKKLKMARLKREKLRHKRAEKKRRAAKLRKKAKAKSKAKADSRAKARSKAKANRKGGRMASVRRGGGGKGRQSKVAGRAKLSNYKGRVRARLAGRARSSGGRGSAIVSFTVTRGGGVRGISVRGGSSAHKSAARRAASGGFPPIPSGVGRSSIRFTVRINFR